MGGPPGVAVPTRWRGSLRLRWLLATFVGVVLALLLAGVLLTDLFREHVMRQFENSLARQLDSVTARLSLDADGDPHVNTEGLSDPRWHRPYSGLYWQLDRVDETQATRVGVLRSRSLWDAALTLDADPQPGGETHVHTMTGPRDEPLMVLERTVFIGESSPSRWRVAVAADTQESHEALARFNWVLIGSLLSIGALMAVAALAQVAVGLRPLARLRDALGDLRDGRSPRLVGEFPIEIQPLVADFNSVLERNDRIVEQARTQAGNLAHALKTPLAVLAQAATGRSADKYDVGDTIGTGDVGETDDQRVELARLVREQIATVQRHVDWHLARARASASRHGAGTRAPVAEAIGGIVRVMQRVHAERGLGIDVTPIEPDLAYAGETEDLQEMLGNLLDNACKWAHRQVRVEAARCADDGATLSITISDDGPGLDAGQRAAALRRGVRLDESVPGSGLGLAIVADLARSVDGSLSLFQAPTGGLGARLVLPAVP
ncbi:MAG: sensor histidine kinase [Burkholderiaceae bacterium]